MRNLYSQGLGSRPMISRALGLAACNKCLRPATKVLIATIATDLAKALADGGKP